MPFLRVVSVSERHIMPRLRHTGMARSGMATCGSCKHSLRSHVQDLARLLRSGNVEQHRDVLERPQAAAALAGVSA